MVYAPWVSPFLEQLEVDGIVSRSAKAAGVTSSAVYALKKRDADFAASWDQALEDSADTLEAEARRRAVVGVQEPVVYQGQLTPIWARDASGEVVMEAYGATDAKTGEIVTLSRPMQARDADGLPAWLTITKHSDALLALLLKGRRKRVFADRTELTGADGGPVTMDATTRRARIASIFAAALARKTEDPTDLA